MITSARPMAISRSRVQTRISWRNSWCGPACAAELSCDAGAGANEALGASDEPPVGGAFRFSSGLRISNCLYFITCAAQFTLASNSNAVGQILRDTGRRPAGKMNVRLQPVPPVQTEI